MPWYWKAAHYIFPAAPATLAFVKLNSMGASMADIRPEYITLWIQAVIYFILSAWVYKRNSAESSILVAYFKLISLKSIIFQPTNN